MKSFFSDTISSINSKCKTQASILWVFSTYLVFYALLFLQLPLGGSLPGDYDTWAHLGIFYENLNHVETFIGINGTHSPSEFFTSMAESRDSNYGVFLIQYPLYLVIRSDLWWYYTFIVVIFALNALAFYSLFNNSKRTFDFFHLLKGLAFASLGYFFGNIDGINVVLLAPLIYAIHRFIQLDGNGNIKKIKFAAIGFALLFIGSIFSIYGFVNFTIALSVLVLTKTGVGLQQKVQFIITLSFITLMVGVFILLTMPGISEKSATPSFDVFTNPYISVFAKDFFTPLIGTVLHPIDDVPVDYKYIDSVHCFYPGAILYLCATSSLIIGFKKRFVWLILFVVGLVISMGSFIEIGGARYELPMYYFYKFLSPNFYRIPMRANQIMLFSLIVLFYFFLISIRRTNYMLSLLLLIFVLIENLPLQMPKFGSDKLISYMPMQVIKKVVRENEVVLNLPYTYLPGVCVDGPSYKSSAMENIYGYWFKKYRLNAVNEITSVNHQPERVLLFQNVNHAINAGTDSRKLFRENHIDYLAVHNQFVCKEDKQKIDRMIKSSDLMNVYEDSSFSLWACK